MEYDKEEPKKSYKELETDFIAEVLEMLDDTKSEINERNGEIEKLDSVVYGKGLTERLQIPFGHDLTKANWLRRVVEIHTDQFMGNGFTVASTYNTKDPSVVEGEDQKRLEADNKKSKEYADQRRLTVQNIIDDNGGMVLFKELAANASAVGTSVLKGYYDENQKKYVLSPVESVENFYVIWSSNDFRQPEAVAYVYQISENMAKRLYGIDDCETSPLGQPLVFNTSNSTPKNTSTQKMVTVIEITGYVEGYVGENNQVKAVQEGEEKELNALIVGKKLVQVIGEEKKLPRYYILPNKRYRRRPWGVSDITDAAIDINLTYIETLSDWRTVSSKVNFPKFKVLGMANDVQIPKPKPRTVEMIPLSEGQDIAPIVQGDSNQYDFKAQLEELKEQFIRETGISRVLFSDPTVTLNSNQALMTSMKPTTDIAIAKKSLWTPILQQIFEDALRVVAEYDESVKEIISIEDDWTLKVVWPDYSAKYDPSANSMLINRFNAGLISIQSFLESMGESKEELDRIMDELNSPTSAAILGHQLPKVAEMMMSQQPAPAPTASGANQPAMINTAANNTPGSGIMSQPGSGATSTSPTGAVAQANQQAGA